MPRVGRLQRPGARLGLEKWMILGSAGAAAALALAAAVPSIDTASAADVSGPARVIDGDTIEVSGTKVRIEGIAAPELDERGGTQAAGLMRG